MCYDIRISAVVSKTNGTQCVSVSNRIRECHTNNGTEHKIVHLCAGTVRDWAQCLATGVYISVASQESSIIFIQYTHTQALCTKIQHNNPEGTRALHWTASKLRQATAHGVKEQTMDGQAPFIHTHTHTHTHTLRHDQNRSAKKDRFSL